MKKYIDPHIEILFFDEEEVLAAPSNTYAAKELNEYLLGTGVGASGTTTVTIQKALTKQN